MSPRFLFLSSLVLIALPWFMQPVEGYKILVIPFGNRSHLIEFHGLGLVLMNRGHEVHIFMSRADPPPSEIAKAGYKFVHPNTNESLIPQLPDDAVVIERINQPLLQQMIQHREEERKLAFEVQHIAKLVMQDTQCLETIKKEKYDFVLADSIFFMYYYFIIPYKLGIPYGGLTTLYEPFVNRVPHFPSAFLDIGFSIPCGVEPTQLGSSLWHRLLNFFAVFMHEMYVKGWAEQVFIDANVTYEEIVSNIAFHMVDQQYLLSDVTPTMPHIRLVGGMATRPANAITDDKLLSFIQDPDRRVIVCSFGSMMASLTLPLLEKLLSAFRQVPQYKVVIRVKNARLQNVPENVLIMDWLPQNDLLGHNNTALFITHSGNNGQNEALYHGVPMVAFYIFGDQLYNADRVARRAYGVKLNLLSFSVESLVESINEVMTNDTYRRNIRKASQIFREQSPGNEAVDLIEHVIKYGSDHLRAHEAHTLSTVEFTMFDIVFAFLVISTIILILVFVAIVKLFNCLRRKF